MIPKFFSAKKNLFPVAAVFIGVMYTWGIALFDSAEKQFISRLIVLFIIAALSYFGLGNNLFIRRQLIPFMIFGIAAAFFRVAGRTVDTGGEPANSWGVWLIIPFIALSAVYTLCAVGLGALIQNNIRFIPERPVPIFSIKTWVVYFAVIMVFWLPTILSLGPIILSPDSRYIVRQALGEQALTDVHPVVYTLILRAFLKFGQSAGSIVFGGYLFGFAQSFFLAGVLAYMLIWLRRQGCPAIFVWSSLALFVVTPSFAGLSVTVWKDIPLNACFLLMIIDIYEISVSNGEWLFRTKNAVKFILLCAAVCFLRANGYQLILICLCLITITLRCHFKRCIALFLPILLVVPIIRGPVYKAIGLSNYGNVELSAVMIQQVAYAVINDAELKENQAAFLNQIMPVETLKETYVYGSVDPVKYHSEFNREFFNDNFGEFIRLWFDLLPDNKDAYLTAWLRETMGYWNPGFATTTGYYLAEMSEYKGLQTVDTVKMVTGHSLQRILLQNMNFISLGSLMHLSAFCVAFLFAVKRRREILCLTPILVLWAGLMVIAPVYAEYRYLLVSALSVPFILFLLFFRENSIKNQ